MSKKDQKSEDQDAIEPVSVETVVDRFASLEKMPDLPSHLLDHDVRKGAFPGPRNKLGYRADEFDDPGDINIAFIGCSWCEGMGVSREFIHAEQTKLILQDRTNLSVRSWNCGLAGTGIDYIARMVPIICNTLRPDFFVIILSNGNRREYYAEDGRRVNFYPGYRKFANRFAPEEDTVLRSAVENLHNLGNHYDEVMKYIVQFRGIAAMLDGYNVPWTHSWTSDINGRSRWQNTLSNAGVWDYTNFLGTHFRYLDVASDEDSHPGIRSHREFAEAVASWIEKKIRQGALETKGISRRKARMSFLDRFKTVVKPRRPNRNIASKSQKQKDDEEIYPLW